MTIARKDLLVLVADADIEQTVQGLLSNPGRLGIRPIRWDIRRHVDRDPGCARRSVEFLRPFRNQYTHALVVFDHEGSGREMIAREELESTLEGELAQNGWQVDAARVVVLEPELEAWVWSSSPHVAAVLGWSDWESLRQWLVAHALLEPEATKPARPKEAMLAVMHQHRLPRSASRFRKLAERVGHGGCRDPSFNKLREVLRAWFGATVNP
jgi:hypothetical protein